MTLTNQNREFLLLQLHFGQSKITDKDRNLLSALSLVLFRVKVKSNNKNRNSCFCGYTPTKPNLHKKTGTISAH